MTAKYFGNNKSWYNDTVRLYTLHFLFPKQYPKYPSSCHLTIIILALQVGGLTSFSTVFQFIRITYRATYRITYRAI